MRKKTLALLLSILIILMPFLGFPTTLKTVFYVVAGLLLVLLIELMTVQYHDIKRKEVDDTLGDNETKDETKEEYVVKEELTKEKYESCNSCSDLLKTEEETIKETTLQEYATHEKQPKNKHKKD